MKSISTYILEQSISKSGTINIFIGCSKSKESKTDKAEDLYTGDLFKKSLAIAKGFKNARIYILSSKHGLVKLDDRLQPYDDYISDKSAEENESWAEEVISQMKHSHINFNDKTYFFCGEDYYRNLIDKFSDAEPVFYKDFGHSLKKLNSIMKKYNISEE